MKRTIFIPNKQYIPMKGCIARKEWDNQETRIEKYKREQAVEKAFQLTIANAIGKTGKENGAYLLPRDLLTPGEKLFIKNMLK